MIEERATSTVDREIVVERVFNAPRELVYEVWAGPDHVAHWWGPTGFTITTHERDVQIGGVWRFMMHGPDGTDYANRVTYIEVVPPERLVYWHDADIDDDPNRFHVTVTFAEQGDRTLLTMRTLFATAAAREFAVREIGAIEGANQTLDRLAEHLASL
jgi:uncharacterized protein YndB with AHSA1/START domain